MDVVVPEAIHQSREALRKALGQQLLDKWRGQYAANTANRFELSPAAKGARRLRTVALGYIAASGADDAAALAFRQFEQADNMTDRQGALGVLINGDSAERVRALEARSEEHTSELQSLMRSAYAVFCLKKKKRKIRRGGG